MKHFLKGVVALVLTCSLTSCFEIIDEMDIKKDGSGEFSLTLNLSKSKTKLESIMLMESINGRRVPSKSEIDSYLYDLAKSLRESDGISSVKYTTDYEDFIFTLRFHFNSVENINSAVKAIASREAKSNKAFDINYAYDINTKSFSRNYSVFSNSSGDYEKLNAEEKNGMNEALFISINRFERQVLSCTNAKSKISKSGNAVMLRSSISNIIQGNTKLSNSIQLN